VNGRNAGGTASS